MSKPREIRPLLHPKTVGVLVPLCFHPDHEYEFADLWKSCLFTGTLFATAEVTALMLCRRRHRIQIPQTEFVRGAIIGFGIGGCAMPAGAWVRDRVLSYFTESVRLGYENTKKKIIKKNQTSAPPILDNKVKKELTKIGQFLDLVGEFAANLGLPLVLYTLWMGGIYQPLLVASLANHEGFKFRKILLRSIRNSGVWLIFVAVPGILGILTMHYRYPHSAERTLTWVYAFIVFGLVLRSSYRLRSILYLLQKKPANKSANVSYMLNHQRLDKDQNS